MTKIQCDAWFCKRCHGYNSKKIFSANLSSGQTYFSNETCKNCGVKQKVKVKTDFWNSSKRTEK